MMLLQATPTNFVSYQSTITNILSNASITPIGTAIQGVAISLVAVTALIGIYEAFFDGGNLRAAAVTMLKYIIVAYIITNWTNLFQTMITDMATVTNTLQGGANVNTDVYDAFNQSLQTYYTSTGDGILTQLFNAASGTDPYGCADGDLQLHRVRRLHVLLSLVHVLGRDSLGHRARSLLLFCPVLDLASTRPHT